MVRRMIGSFIDMHKEMVLQGMSLRDWVASDAPTIDQYRDTILLMDKEDARGLIIVLAPLVLRVSLNVVLYDVKGQNAVFIVNN